MLLCIPATYLKRGESRMADEIKNPQDESEELPADGELQRKTIAFPAELMEFYEERAKLRGNDQTSMIREALFQWATEHGYRRWRWRKRDKGETDSGEKGRGRGRRPLPHHE